jgi:hypothetical protein
MKTDHEKGGIIPRHGDGIASKREWVLVVVELVEAGELVSDCDAIAPFSIPTEFDRIFAFDWLTVGVSEVSVIRAEL